VPEAGAAPAGGPLVAVQEVSYRYPTGADAVLRGVSLELRRGEFVGLVGTTGAGKSTFCLTLNGLIPHYAGGTFKGRALVDGQDTRERTVADLSARVGLVFQDADGQLMMSTVEEECLLGPLSQGRSRAEARERARRILETLEIGHLAGRPPQTLSGGQKQRTAIAAVMATEPEVLVLDEATSELDALTVHKLFALCARLNRERGTTILIVSHEMELLATHATRLALMSDGRIIADGPPREVLSEVARFRAAGVRLPQVVELADRLRGEIPWPQLPLTEGEAEEAIRKGRAMESGGRGTSASLSPWERAGVRASNQPQASSTPGRSPHPNPLPGGEGTEVPSSQPPAVSEPIIRLQDVRFSYRAGVDALRRMTLAFEPGEFTAIIGNNGSGKSTLMKLIVGLLKPTAGRVVVDGVDTRGAKVSSLAQKIGFIFQNPNDQLFANTVEEEITFGLRNLALPPDEIAARLEATLEQFDLTGVRAVFPRFLSRGDKQKVCIASIVAMRPRVLLLDEPTTGQDHRDSRQILDLATELNRRGMTVLLVTHDLINVAEYARRVIVLTDGELVRDGPTAEVMADEALLATCSLVPPQIVRLSLRLRDLGLPLAMHTPVLADAVRARNRSKVERQRSKVDGGQSSIQGSGSLEP
jgi:energy-coupling factor transport system ATP-binding protein